MKTLSQTGLISIALTLILARQVAADVINEAQRCVPPSPGVSLCSSGSYVSIIPATTSTYPGQCPQITCLPIISATASVPAPTLTKYHDVV
ncbi:hypothetical protein FA15DRAFT_673813, partial [Coprinopsis marcescibilis]